MSNKHLAFLATAALCAVGCAGPDEPASAGEVDQRYGDVTTTPTSEPVFFTTTPYDFTGQTPIADVLDLIPADEFTWQGTASDSPWPVSGACDTFGNEVASVPELPTHIEGIVTLHPRYFQKTNFCVSEERYYASYLMQDSSGGILVLKDSRIADFTFGDRVKLRVLGLLKFFDTFAVVVHDSQEVVSRGNDIYYEDAGARDLGRADVGKVVRVRRKVASEPTNSNFNELCLVPEGDDDTACDPRCAGSDMCGGWVLASIDRELGQRNPHPIKKGQIVEITGPVVNSFGLRILVSDIGQINFIEE